MGMELMKPIQEREEEFQTALKEWTEMRSKHSWDVMFFHISRETHMLSPLDNTTSLL